MMYGKEIREVVRDEKIAQALSDDVKVSILKLLNERGPMTISEISKVLGKHRSSVYRHLVVLENAELIRREIKRGAHIFAISALGQEALNILLKRSGAEVLLEVKRKRIKKSMRLKSLTSILLYLPAMVFAAIGIKGAMYRGEIHALSRIMWFSIFIGLTMMWVFFARKVAKWMKL